MTLPTLHRVGPDYPHWPLVATLIRKSFAYMAPILGHPARAAALNAEDLSVASACGTAFLLIDAETPVACLFTRPSRDFKDALYLGWLAIEHQYRGRALAHILFDAAEAEAISQGKTALTLDTGRALTDLHRLFARIGFCALPGNSDVVTFRKELPRQLDPEDPALVQVFDLLKTAFAYMDGRIDPPSSLHMMTLDSLRQDARNHEIWIIEEDNRPAACMTLATKAGTLYLGKLAVDPDSQGRGLARRLLNHAEARARALGLPSLTLQTRVELSENHAAFRALGFRKTGETAHPGFARATSYTFVKSLV